VPPSQSEVIRDACAAKGLKCKYVLYEGEGHGFVKESSVVDSVQQELLFYGEALGFTPAL
jgi:dipeptidyl aminopeptidase/acylaminoacyl peptidase